MYACFDQPDLKATFTLTRDRAGRLEGRLQRPGRAPTEDVPGRRPADALRHHPAAVSPYITALVAGPYHEATDSARRHRPRHLLPGVAGSSTSTPTRSSRSPSRASTSSSRPSATATRSTSTTSCFVPEFNAGAMENAGCVTFLEDYVFRSKVDRRRLRAAGRDDPARDGAHVVRRPGDHAVVGRPLAERVVRHLRSACSARPRRPAGPTPGRRSPTPRRRWAYRQDQLPSTHPIAADIPDVQAVEVNFDGITYAKGASVLKQLAAYVGIEAFLDALAGYFRDHEYANTTLVRPARRAGEELRPGPVALVGPVAGDRRRQHAARRVRGRSPTAGSPPSRSCRTRRPSTTCCATTGWRSGSTTARRCAGCSVIELDVSGERTQVPELSAIAQPDLVLVNDDDLTYAKIRLDERSLATVTERIGDAGRLAAPGPVLGGGLGHDPRRRNGPRATSCRLVLQRHRRRDEHRRGRSPCTCRPARRWAPTPTRTGRSTGWAQLADHAARRAAGRRAGQRPPAGMGAAARRRGPQRRPPRRCCAACSTAPPPCPGWPSTPTCAGRC